MSGTMDGLQGRGVIAQYQEQRQMAEVALGRVDDAAFFAQLNEGGDDHTNSIAILVKHISGNFISRWTDFLDHRRRKSQPPAPARVCAGNQ